MRIVGISRSFAEKAESDLELFSKLVDFRQPNGRHNPVQLSRDLFAEKNGSKAMIMTRSNGGYVVLGVVDDLEKVRSEILKNGVMKGLVETKRGKVVPADKSLLGALRVF